MSGSFSFGSNLFSTAVELDWWQMSTGDSTGLVNNSADFSVVSNTQLIDPALDKDIFALALVAGQTVTFDVDQGAGGASSVDTEINIVDATGALVASGDDSASLDAGSISILDPLLTFTAATSGIYFISVADYRTDYINGSFTFGGGTAATGDYRFVASTSFLPALVTYGPGVDNLTLGNLPDRIYLGDGDDIASLGGGNDIAYGGFGTDTIDGGDGDDVIDGEADADTVNGGNGDDVITSSSFSDQSFGGDGNDQLYVNNAVGCLADGQAGDDFVIVFSSSSGILAGGLGLDTLSLLDLAAAVTVDLSANTTGGGLAGTTISGFENVIGGVGGDTLTGNSIANKITGGAGADQLYGRGGNDILVGGVDGDAMDGEGGFDTADYSLSKFGVTVNLLTNVHSGGDAQGDFLQNIENVMGSSAPDTLTGNDLANTLNGGGGGDSLDGGLGNDTMIGGENGDTYYLRQAGDVIVETGASGIDTVRSFLTAYTLAATLENLFLDFAGNANGTGNASANLIFGNNFNNVIDGKAGIDDMRGGGGNDSYYLDTAADAVFELPNEGTDTIYASFSANLEDESPEVENLVLLGAGNINGTGSTLNNVITGNAGRNTLDGRSGSDTLRGGAGNDTYLLLLDVSDTIVELANEGTDEVWVNKSYTLAANVENLTVAGSLAGQTFSGNALANRIIGNAAGETLDGKAGADYMAGSGGDDTYIVDTALDATVELAGEGSDTVRSSITHTLRVNVENLTLSGAANINGSGNSLSNLIIGNDGSNILNGLGGNDTMAGGNGNDTYYFDSAFDVAAESLNQGIDIVQYSGGGVATLGANIEKLYLLGSASSAFGNALSNFIYGNALSNVMDGGAGADRLYGGNGNDEYYLDSAGDLVFETTAGAAGGSDTVHTFVNHTLGTNFENLELTGAGNANGTGNTQANFIFGNSGNNFIDGKEAADMLSGGLGLDNFVFSTALGAANIDTISDFTVADDTIRLENAIFAALPVGFLAVAAFHSGASAADAGDRIIYNSATGALFYDADGLGGAAQVRFATLSTGLAMTNADFFVF
jgi:Ca2+-binding RTX toxin-like protein